jgi:hypothetical protein
MPVRIIGYDGAAYRSQLLKKNTRVYPVVTIVLYFGTEHKWDGPMNLKALLDIPDGLDEYVNDYRIHVFNIAWLSEEEIARFKSDFKIVANFFAQIRRNKDYVPDDPTEIEHVDAVLKLLTVMTGDPQFTFYSREQEVKNMYGVASRLVDEGRREGRMEGRMEGRREGRQSVIVGMLKKGKTAEQIVEFCDFPLEEVQEAEKSLLEVER